MSIVEPNLGFVFADQLQAMLEEGSDKWPLPQEVGVVDALSEYAAFADSDKELLQRLCGWQTSDRQNLPYIIDPLAERIKDAFADLIFGSDTDFESAPVITKNADGTEKEQPGPDQESLDGLVEENDLVSELQDAAGRCVAEGEVWWRIYVDRDAFEHPVIEWHSRLGVIPLYRGRKLLAAAFVSDLSDLAPDAPVVRVGDDTDPPGTTMWREQPQGRDGPVWRYVEIQTGGMTRSLLYCGTRTTLGMREELSAHPETADLNAEWIHGLEVETESGRSVPLMLAGRITNGAAGRLGRSQYKGVRGLLYELNKLASVGGRNVELTMQKRAVLSADVVSAMIANEGDGTLKSTTKVPIPDAFMVPGANSDALGEAPLMGVLEFSDAWAEALLAWDGGLTDKILTRCRVAPQLVGRHTEDAATGPALRARLLDSVLAADGKARKWDAALPKIVMAAQMVDALGEERGGCGNDWKHPDEPPTVIRASVLPEDETEEVTKHSMAVEARIESRQTAIERLTPEWDDERVQEEMKRIEDETPEPPPIVVAPGQEETAKLKQGQPAGAKKKPPPKGGGATASGGNNAGR